MDSSVLPKDYMTAMLVCSTALLALSPVLLGFTGVYRSGEGSGDAKKRFGSLLSRTLASSFITGLLTVSSILAWFTVPSWSWKTLSVIFFAAQILSFTFGSVTYYMWTTYTDSSDAGDKGRRQRLEEGYRMKDDFQRNWRKLLCAGICAFVLIVFLAICVTAEFSFHNIGDDPYYFIRRFLSQWSPALGAAGSLIAAVLAGTSIYWSLAESQRKRKAVEGQLIRALYYETMANLIDVKAILHLQQSVSDKAGIDTRKTVTELLIRPLRTAVFDNMLANGELNILGALMPLAYLTYAQISWNNRSLATEDDKKRIMGELEPLHSDLEKLGKSLETEFKHLQLRVVSTEPAKPPEGSAS